MLLRRLMLACWGSLVPNFLVGVPIAIRLTDDWALAIKQCFHCCFNLFSKPKFRLKMPYKYNASYAVAAACMLKQDLNKEVLNY